MSNQKFTYGSDPELCLFDKEKNRIVSSIPVLKRDKNNPIDLGKGIRMYFDNVLVETSFPPTETKEKFISELKYVLTKMHKFLGNRYQLIPKAAHFYDNEELKDEKAWEAGCDPNFDFWEERINTPIEFTNNLRTGSCHFHVGNEKLTELETRHTALKLMDIFLGCSSVIFDKDKSSKTRRVYYGASGEFRPTYYGLEYRVISPYVLNSPKLMELSLDLIDYSLSNLENGEKIIKSIKPEEVKTAINKCNKKLAEKILSQVSLPTKLIDRVKKDYKFKKLHQEWGI